MRLISQLVKDISRVLQKLLKYFNGTAILTFFILSSSGDFPVIFCLNLNKSQLPEKSAIFPSLSKLAHFCNIGKNFQMISDNYHHILLNYTPTSQNPELLHYLLVCYFAYAVNKWCALFKYYFFISVLPPHLLLLLILSLSPSQVAMHHYNYINLTLAL